MRMAGKQMMTQLQVKTECPDAYKFLAPWGKHQAEE